MNYPAARVEEQTDVYHGVTVRDPYRWLEDANSTETKAWVEAENAVTFDFLRAIPEREVIQSRLRALWDYEKYGLPSKQGGRYFWTKNDGLQNQAVLYVGDTLDDAGRVLLDPNTLSSDGTIALSSSSVSEDGKLLAYGLSAAGSDWQEWRIRDIETGTDLSDHLKWLKNSSVSWTKDNAGFFYSRYAEPTPGAAYQEANYYRKLYYHRVGDAQGKDVLVYERPDEKEWFISGTVTEDGKYLLIYTYKGTERQNRLFYKDLSSVENPVIELFGAGDASYSVIQNDGPIFYVLTDKDAPRKRVVSVDISQPDKELCELIPETRETLQSVSLLGDTFYANYLKDAATEVKLFGLDGSFQSVLPLPGLGSAGGWYGKRDATETFYSFSGYTTPATIYRYDLATGESSVYKKANVAFNPDDYETHRVFYASKDGTQVPLFLTHKKGLVLDGTNPTYLYGYGGFTISLTPGFSVGALVWMEMGGVYAVACLRGGGEYGQEWHDAGTKLKKQNVFDDFIAAGEWLTANHYTSTSKLAIAGGSNGGLLVGACMTQRPDLFGAALPAVGVLDMLRFDKFTIGWAWKSDYGSPSDNAGEFAANRAYSPYHNLNPGTRYPATLVTTSDHDDRVVPAHSFKFAAALQSAQDGDGPPTLIRIETQAGHGAGKPTAKIIEETADRYAFLAKVLHVKLPVGFGESRV